MYDPQLLETLIRFDPARRGLATTGDAGGGGICSGGLHGAAEHLALHGRRVLIVTGFAVVLNDRVTAETDGPLGALFLASMLEATGLEARFATDRYAADILRAGCEQIGLPKASVIEFPQGENDRASRESVAAWRRTHADTDAEYSHLVFIERVGPSHTFESAATSSYKECRSEIIAEFERLVPVSDRDVCHNMRGESIDAYTAPLHLLVKQDHESAFSPPGPKTIGIVDGGNEIGCGAIEWDALRGAISSDVAARIACRVATDFTIPSGVSNWGAYALAVAAVSIRRPQRPEAMKTLVEWTSEKHQKLLATLVAAGAVDGVTKRAESTVDGILLDAYLAQFERIKAAVV